MESLPRSACYHTPPAINSLATPGRRSGKTPDWTGARQTGIGSNTHIGTYAPSEHEVSGSRSVQPTDRYHSTCNATLNQVHGLGRQYQPPFPMLGPWTRSRPGQASQSPTASPRKVASSRPNSTPQLENILGALICRLAGSESYSPLPNSR